MAEAKNKESTWDVYVGMTPFVEMTQLIKAGVIQPWDDFIPKDVLDDIIPSIREECSIEGKLYSGRSYWTSPAWAGTAAITDKAGVNDAPKTWDDVLAARKADHGQQGRPLWLWCMTRNGWRSLAPMTHSLSTKVYTSDGRFDFNNEAVVEALKLMKKLKDLGPANLLEPGATDGGVNGTPDEVAFAAEKAGYYFKYFNAPYRMAANLEEARGAQDRPVSQVCQWRGQHGVLDNWRVLVHPWQEQGEGRRVHEEDHLRAEGVAGQYCWQRRHPPGAVATRSPAFTKSWDEKKPDWLPEAINTIYGQLPIAKAITNHLFGLKQFQIARPFYEKYLKGEETDEKKVLAAVHGRGDGRVEEGGVISICHVERSETSRRFRD